MFRRHFALILTGILGGVSWGADPNSGEPFPTPFVPDRLIVRLEPSTADRRPPALPGIVELRRLIPVSKRRPEAPTIDGPHQLYRATTAPGAEVSDLAVRLTRDPRVRFAEPDYIYRLTDTLPDDPSLVDLWGLHNEGQTGGIEDADIDAPAAWDLATGSGAIVVGVIDTGIDFRHPDLVANLWVNGQEIPGDRVDNDLNGYVDDVFGFDFLFNDPNPSDPHRHGTHVAGTIGAVGNNGIGVVGVNWTCRLMALRVFSAAGSGSVSDAAEAFFYAMDNGARILSNSWGGTGVSQALQEAIRAAHEQDVLVVAAAGNQWRTNEVVPLYPASYDDENIVSVAATDDEDALALFSNTGNRLVDLGAPGVAVVSTVPPYVNLFSEDFAGAVPPSLGGQFTFAGANNLWGTVEDPLTGAVAARGDATFSSPYSADADGWIVTPLFDTRQLDGLSVQFNYRYETEDFFDTLVVEVWNGTAWVRVFERSGADEFAPGFQFARIDLDPHRNERMQVRFGWITNSVENDFYGAEIDNIAIRHIGSDYDQAYGSLSGTSMATPHVSGAAALLLAADPSLCLTDLKQRLIFSGDPVPALAGLTRSGRRLNVAAALRANLCVAQPHSGNSWVAGTIQRIEWIPGECGTADIVLLKGGALVEEIAIDAPNNGVHIWSIPGALEAGADYQVRVETESSVTDGDPFELRAGRAWFVHASASGTRDGSSWIDAFSDLDSAVAAAERGDEVWVAAGTYTPTCRYDRNLARSETFRIPPGIALLGGFAGTEMSRDQRDPALNRTTLSGDLASDDLGARRNGENSFHVAVFEAFAPTPATIDGFVISGGNANGSTAGSNGGGGLFGSFGAVRIVRCEFVGNSANSGGGTYACHSLVMVANSTFRENTATSGGAIDSQSSVTTLWNCELYDNSAASSASAFQATGDGCTRIVNTTFFENHTAGVGGAVQASAPVTIDNSILWSNTPLQISGELTDVNLSFSCIENGFSGDGNLSLDPGFRNASIRDLRLGLTSPCVNTGDNGRLPVDTLDLDRDGDRLESLPTDRMGNARVVFATVDMGAFELKESAAEVVRGDCDQDGTLSLGDALCNLGFIFLGQFHACPLALDFNDSDANELSDPLGLLLFLFANGPPPSAPFPNCGADPTLGPLACDRFTCP